MFLCVTKSLITKCERQSIITANSSGVLNTEYRPIFLVINIDHKQLLFLPVLCAHSLHDSGADGMACSDFLHQFFQRNKGRAGAFLQSAFDSPYLLARGLFIIALWIYVDSDLCHLHPHLSLQVKTVQIPPCGRKCKQIHPCKSPLQKLWPVFDPVQYQAVPLASPPFRGTLWRYFIKNKAS